MIEPVHNSKIYISKAVAAAMYSLLRILYRQFVQDNTVTLNLFRYSKTDVLFNLFRYSLTDSDSNNIIKNLVKREREREREAKKKKRNENWSEYIYFYGRHTSLNTCCCDYKTFW